MIKKFIILIAGAWFCMAFMSLKDHTLPKYFPKPVYSISNNIEDSLLQNIGRYLFYDPILSADNTISCASCHTSYNAFAHTDHDLSHGIQDQIGNRNAPALFNLAWQKELMWDGAIHHIDLQALAPLHHPKEMGSSINEVVSKLRQDYFYKRLFSLVYRDSIITGERVLKALSQFQLTLVSATAKYDAVREGVDTFTVQEQRGYALFQQYCNSCHTEPLFSHYGFENNGLPIDSTLMDLGRVLITHKAQDSFCFKVPSLRNLSFTYPYMHDGRYKKMIQVLNHYSDGIVNSSTLSKQLKEGIPLTSNQKVDLIAFLLTLNDRKFVFDPQHQYPKKIFN
jgi:cytochrome c peroxidase